MSIPQRQYTWALAFAAAVALAGAQTQAKSDKMCFVTGSGKHFLAIDNGGMVHAKATRCAGPAVFKVDDFTARPTIAPRAGLPVTIKAANGRYPQYYGKAIRATAPKINSKYRRFQFNLRPSHGGVKFGQPLAPKMRMHLFPMLTRFALIASMQRGGGGAVANLKRPPANALQKPLFFYTLAPAVDPRVAALRNKVVALRKAIAANQAEIKKRAEMGKRMITSLKKTEAMLKAAQ